jgi:hypothetical protein
MEKICQIIQQIETKQKMPMQNKALILKYLKSGKTITFYDFECPPRFIDQDKSGKIFINYLVKLNKIFEKEKIDHFTEIPHCIKNQTREIKTIKFLQSLGINFRFAKIIADTNLDYITPNSKKILGKKKIKNNFQKFKKLIQKQCQKYSIEVRIVLFSDLIKNFKKDYQSAFNYALKNNLISAKILKEQIKRTQQHIGIKNQDEAIEFSRRTIATYAAEGIVFNKLSQTKNFSNSVWLNMDESNKRTIVITNSLRKKRKIGPLPMIFL